MIIVRQCSLTSAEEKDINEIISQVSKGGFVKNTLLTLFLTLSMTENKWVFGKHHSPLLLFSCPVLLSSPVEMRVRQTRQSLHLLAGGPQTMQRGGLEQKWCSGAGSPHVHLFGDLQHKDNVWPLVWDRVDAHADQVSQL